MLMFCNSNILWLLRCVQLRLETVKCRLLYVMLRFVAEPIRQPVHNCIYWSKFLPFPIVWICKRLRSPGTDSKDSILPAHVARWAGTINWVVVAAKKFRNKQRYLKYITPLAHRSQTGTAHASSRTESKSHLPGHSPPPASQAGGRVRPAL